MFKQSNLPIATDFPLFLTNLDYVVASTPDSRLVRQPVILSLTLWGMLCIPGPIGSCTCTLTFPSRPRPIRFTTVKNPLYTPLSPASPHPIHLTVKNPTRLIWLYKQRPLQFPGRQRRPITPHHTSSHTLVVVRYRVLYHPLPLIASLPLYQFDRFSGWANYVLVS